jgi:hypothetical protein
MTFASPIAPGLLSWQHALMILASPIAPGLLSWQHALMTSAPVDLEGRPAPMTQMASDGKVLMIRMASVYLDLLA